MNIEIGARVHTRDGRHVGHVHRLVIDLDDRAVTAIVVLRGAVLTRDVLVPLDLIDRADGGDVVLTLDADQLDQLPDFAYNELFAPPPMWTSVGPFPDGTFYVPVAQRKRLGEHHVDLARGAHVRALDGDIGTVERIDFDDTTGELSGFWVRADGVFQHDMRIPAEWVRRVDDSGVLVNASRREIEARLGPQSRALGARVA